MSGPRRAAGACVEREKPTGNTPDYRASSTRIGKFIRQTRNAVGSIFLASSRARHWRTGRLTAASCPSRGAAHAPEPAAGPTPRKRPCAWGGARPEPSLVICRKGRSPRVLWRGGAMKATGIVTSGTIV
jgi:hypothetical protein